MSGIEEHLYYDLLETCGDDYHELKDTLMRMLERVELDLEELQCILDEANGMEENNGYRPIQA